MTIFTQLKKGPLKVSVIGGGNWGTAIAMLVAENAANNYLFDNNVILWGLEKEVEESINKENENKLYLPGIKLPTNLTCSTDLAAVTAQSDLIIMVVPHQFVVRTANTMKAHVKPTAQVISLIKGLHIDETSKQPQTFSSIITDILGVDCAALSGANVAKDVALKQFSESTIGFDSEHSDTVPIWQQLFDTPNFKIRCIPDKDGVEVNGAIKNVVAIAAGFCDGLGLGTNAKSAIIRIGAQEIRLFCALFFKKASVQSFFESCGFADLITTCWGGRNARCAAEYAKRGGAQGGATWEAIEAEMLGGQFLQGTLTTKEIAEILEHYGIFESFPLFKATYDVAFKGKPINHVVDVFRTNQPLEGSILSENDIHGTVKIPAGLEASIQRASAEELARLLK